MQDPERLLEQGSEFERSLLEGGIAERPNSALTRRMALGAGLGGALSYTSSAEALIRTWWGKTVALVAVGAGVAGVVIAGAQPSEGPEPDAAAPAVVFTPLTSSTPAPVPRASEPTQAEEARAAKQASTPAPAIEPRGVSSKRIKPGSTLAQEIKALDRVRGLMAQGDRAAALAELDSYDRRYPAGTLEREARVLRARATQQP